MTEEEFMLSMKKVIEFITDNYRNPEKFPVSPGSADYFVYKT